MHSKRKIPDLWWTGWKAKACTSFSLYLKVFKNHLYYLWHVRMLSIKPCLHTQSLEPRSYWKVSWGWGHLITWNGPTMGHLNSSLASGGGNLNKNFPKNSNAQGVAGGGCLSFNLTGSLWAVVGVTLCPIGGPSFTNLCAPYVFLIDLLQLENTNWMYMYNFQYLTIVSYFFIYFNRVEGKITG